MAFDTMGYLQDKMDRVVLRALDPRTKGIDDATKERLKNKLIEKGSFIWQRKKARLGAKRNEKGKKENI